MQMFLMSSIVNEPCSQPHAHGNARGDDPARSAPASLAVIRMLIQMLCRLGDGDGVLVRDALLDAGLFGQRHGIL